MKTLAHIGIPSGANAHSCFQPFPLFLIPRNFDIWQKHDVVKHCGIDLLTVEALVLCVVAHG